MSTLTRAVACVAALFSASCFGADSSDLVCRPTSSEHWVESIRISTSQNKVWLKLKQYTWTSELPLLFVGPDQVEQPIYAFNDLPDGPTDKVVNAFKVFRVGKTWRLIDAGLEPRQGTLTLRAIGKSEELDCDWKEPDKSLERTRER